MKFDIYPANFTPPDASTTTTTAEKSEDSSESFTIQETIPKSNSETKSNSLEDFKIPSGNNSDSDSSDDEDENAK